MSKPSVLDLVSKTVSGDREAFEQLMVLRRNTITSKIFMETKNPDEVEDISQKVAIRIYQNIGTLKSPEAFDSWLNKLVLRECFRHFAAKEPTEYLECSDLTEGMFVETDTDCLPLAYVENLELKEELKGALVRMPEASRRMVILHYEKEMGYREIASCMGVTVGTVSANLNRARNRLRKELLPS